MVKVVQQRVDRGKGKSRRREVRQDRRSAILTFAGRTSDEFWEVETDLTRVSLTRASNEGKPVRVFEADVKRDLALGRRNHVRVGQANLKL